MRPLRGAGLMNGTSADRRHGAEQTMGKLNKPWESRHVAVAVAGEAPAPQRSVGRSGEDRAPVRHPAAAVDDLHPKPRHADFELTSAV